VRNPFDIFSPTSPLFREETEDEKKKTPTVGGQSPFDVFSPSSPLWRGEEVRPKPGYGNLPPEAEKFMAGPTGIPARAEQMSALEKALTVLDPLLLPGDVAKAFAYGALTGGIRNGLRLAKEQLSRWRSYLPGGAPAQAVVRGDELARLIDPNYDNRSGAAKLGLAVLMDVMTDPLSAFGIAKAGLTLAASGARAAGAASVAEVVSKGAELAGRADVLAQRFLNPYGVAIGATRTIGGPVIDAIAERVEPILQTKLFERTVYGPQGEKVRIPVYVKDLIFHGFSPGERRELLEKIPSYLGGPETGPGIVRRVIAEAQENIQASVARISALENILAENLGEKVLPFSARKVILKGTPQEVLAKELTADVWNILDKHGWVVPDEVIKATTQKLRGLAKSLGLQPEVAVKTFNDYLREARLAFLDISYRATGMPTYERIFKATAKEMGLDPDLAWQRYLGERARFMPKLDERGRLVDLEQVEGALFQAPRAPKVDLDSLVKSTQAGYRVLSEGPDAPGALRIFYAMPATAQESLLKNVPQLAERNARYINGLIDVAPNLSENLDAFLGRLRGDDFLRYFPGQSADDANKVLGRLRAAAKSDDPARLALHLGEATQKLSGEQVMRMLASKSPVERGLGYSILGTVLEDIGDYAMASIAHSFAAMNLLKAEKKATARYFYMSGGHVLDDELVKQLKAKHGLDVPVGALPRVTEEIQDLLRSATLDGDTVQAIYSWMASIPAGNRALLRDELAKIETPAGRLANAIASGDREALKDLLLESLRGFTPTDASGLESILGLAKRVLGEEGVADVLYKVGVLPSADLAQARTVFADNLMAVEKRAIERFWAEHPRWMGATDRQALLGKIEDGKWVGYPYSPLQWMADVRQGYARKVYLGNISPEAAKAAITAGRLALVSEVEADTLAQRAVEYLKKIGRTGDIAKAERAFQELAEYIKASDGRYVYTAEAFARILKQHWPELDSATFNALLHDVINGTGKEYQAYLVLSKAQSGLNVDLVGAPISQAVPGAMRERLAEELTRHLVQLYDVEASVAEFARYSSRQQIAGHIQDQLFKALKEANLVYDAPPAEVVRSTHLRFVQVPEATTYMGEAGERAYVWGPLAGKWIPKAIYEDLNRTLSVDPISGTAFASFLTFWRKSLLNSPDTVVRNFLGNIWLTWLTAGPEQALLSLKYLPKAFKALREYAETGRIAELGDGAIYMLKDASLTGELREVVENAAARIAQAARGAISGKGVIQRTIEALDRVLNETGRTIAKYFTANPDASPLTRALSGVEMFAYLENAQRLANYFAAKELAKGAGRANPEAYAMWVAMNATHDYRAVPFALNIVKNYGLVAFPSFMYLTAVAVGKALTKNPTALTLPAKFASMSFYTNTDSAEDHARIAMYMPEWLAQSMPTVLPIRREDGSYLVLPLSYAAPIIPFEPTSLATEVVGMGFLRPFIEAAYGLIRDDPRPVFSVQFGKRLFPDVATPAEKAFGVGAYVAKSFTPRWITRYSPLSDPELLLRDLAQDQSALQTLDSVVGKLWVQYKHPAIVDVMERRLGKQLGMTGVEAAASLVATPRRVSPDPLGVGSRATALEPERMKNELLRDFTNAIKWGVDFERARERALRELEKVERKLAPLLELNEIFGPPPDLGGEYGP
jgi:hypothetical protein